MKHLVLLVACFITSTNVLLLADNDKPIMVNELPGPARLFIEKHFVDTKVSFAKKDAELFDKSYEVFFVDGSKIEFNNKGEWTEIDCKFTRVPDGAVPLQIQNYVKTNNKDCKVVEIDRDKRDYEVKLDNGLELKFDLKYNLIGYDN